MTDLHYLSIAEAAPLLRSRELSPVTLVDAFLAQIDKVDGMVKSYLLVDAEGARAKARIAEAEIAAGRYRGPLHGIPYGVKDNHFTKGLRTCANSRVLLDHVPDSDATAVERLDAAGAILLGKLNTWEYGTGLGLVYHDAAFPHAVNPWNREHATGGSSTGSGAAVAAGTAMFAMGADTGGSIRVPASGCGIQGFKPTYGLISRAGVLPGSWSMDVLGPMTWTIEDNAIAMQALAGYDPLDADCVDLPVPDYSANLKAGVEGMTIGFTRHLITKDGMDDAIAAGMEDMAAALSDLGAAIVEVEMPETVATYRQSTTLIAGSERASLHEADFLQHGDKMGRELRDGMMVGLAGRAVDYLACQRRRRVMAAELDAVVRRFDAMIVPSTFRTAPRIDDKPAVREFNGLAVTAPFNVSGHPGLAIRTGFSAAGLPSGAQIVGPYFSEATILRVAYAYEAARDWHTRRPSF
jgi:aspartyl-tRNA(Asn)/glutamyl-tRNA(Gln) amidotransferase subunit A